MFGGSKGKFGLWFEDVFFGLGEHGCVLYFMGNEEAMGEEVCG